MIVGIVGSEQAKFTLETEQKARNLIRALLSRPKVTGACSGGCHLGGIDIYTKEIAEELGLPFKEFLPRERVWSGGYKERNLEIARHSDAVICITVKELPPDYQGMRFKFCYHCKAADHVKSGGCWTVKEAAKLGKITKVYVV